jgi:hypothetical protein
MPFAFLLLIVVALFVITRAAQRGGRSALLVRGISARGLILSAARTSSDATYGGQRFEVRSLVLDVEVPGSPPYEVSLSTMIPRICEALPGAALDLRVDPSKPNNLVIVGPAGSSQWLRAAASVPGQTWATQSTASRSGCGTVLFVLVALSLALASVLSFSGGARSVDHSQCEAAARCCESVGWGSCKAFLSDTEEVCATALVQEQRLAQKVGKRCK